MKYLLNSLFSKVVAILFLTVLLFSCVLPTANDDPPIYGFIDIRDALSLMVAPANTADTISSSGIVNSSRAVGSGEVLLKETADGYFKSVDFSDTDGNSTTQEIPLEIISLHNVYVILRFLERDYLVNRETGAAYNFTEFSLSNINSDFPNQFVDDAGYLYFESSGRVMKMDVSNPQAVAVEAMTPSSNTVSMFAVDSAGNILYKYNDGARVRTENNLIDASDVSGAAILFRGLDGYVYHIGSSSGDSDMVSRMDVDAIENIIWTDIGEHNGGFQYSQGQYQKYLEIANRIIILKHYGEQLEIYNPTATPRGLPLSFSLPNPVLLAANESEMYLVSRDGELIRYNPTTDEETEIISSGQYDFNSIVLDVEGNLYFTGLQLSVPFLRVAGMIDTFGNLTILSNVSDSDVVVLTPL